ncbi:MAG: hypothetical protein AAFQ51_18090, partial [Pseudomonadota bacterium]
MLSLDGIGRPVCGAIERIVNVAVDPNAFPGTAAATNGNVSPMVRDTIIEDTGAAFGCMGKGRDGGNSASQKVINTGDLKCLGATKAADPGDR